MSHLYVFFPSWMESLCSLTLIFWEKHLPHISHLNGFFPSCNDKECFFKLPFVEKSDLQTSQLKGFFIDFSILVNNPLSPWADDYWLRRQQETEQVYYCYENFQQINHATYHLWYQTTISGIHETSVLITPKIKVWLKLLGMPDAYSWTMYIVYT